MDRRGFFGRVAAACGGVLASRVVPSESVLVPFCQTDDWIYQEQTQTVTTVSRDLSSPVTIYAIDGKKLMEAMAREAQRHGVRPF